MQESVAPTTAEEADRALLTVDEAPAVETPDVAADASVTSPVPDQTGQPRDEQGRFTSAPPAPEAPPVDPSTVPPPSDETPTAPATPETPATPFVYQADGQAVEIPGSLTGEDGVFIPAAEVPKIQRLLAEGHAWNGSAQRYFQENNQRQQATEARATAAEEKIAAVEAERAHILGHFEQLIEASKDYPPDQMFQSPLGQWLLDIRGGWGVLKAEARADRIERERQSDAKRIQEYEAQREEATLRPQIDKSLSDYVLHFGQAAGLNRDQMEQVYADLKRPEYEGLWLVRAPEDDPLNRIKKGERVINYGVIEQEVSRVAKWLAPFRSQATPSAPAAPVAPTPPVKKPSPPPTVAATRSPSPRKAPVQYKTREEADDALLMGGEDID